MAKHPVLWVLGGLGVLMLLGRSQAAQAAAYGGAYAPGYAPPGSMPYGTGLFSSLTSLFGGGAVPNNAGGYTPPGGGFYTGLGNQNYLPVNYSPAATAAPTAGATQYQASPGAYTGAPGYTPGMMV